MSAGITRMASSFCGCESDNGIPFDNPAFLARNFCQRISEDRHMVVADRRQYLHFSRNDIRWVEPPAEPCFPITAYSTLRSSNHASAACVQRKRGAFPRTSYALSLSHHILFWEIISPSIFIRSHWRNDMRRVNRPQGFSRNNIGDILCRGALGVRPCQVHILHVYFMPSINKIRSASLPRISR